MNLYATRLFPTGVSQVDNGEYYWYSAQPLEVSAFLGIYQSLDKGRIQQCSYKTINANILRAIMQTTP